ncbi:hypothetical protein AVEN_244645-1 [Araneus ventricosus]|uniref:Uncharacterized protein n=1 Tax=Araneus ventricosus TaxID=182803 RepID=A0A4Y2PFY6_ARAVE|nr:hypothetical protein AVEN_244645-1 [Araneus ventricosus]
MNAVILNRSLPNAPLHTIPVLAHPFRHVIHGLSTQCKSICYGSLRSSTASTSHLCLLNSNPRLLGFHLERALSPTYLHRSHFSIYGLAVQMERLDRQIGCYPNFPPPPSKLEPPPARIPSRASPLPHLSTPVTFQHLWPCSPNGAVGYTDWLAIQTSEHTAPFLTSFSPCRPVLAWRARI